MDVFAQWPASFSTGPRPEAEKFAYDDTLEGLVKRAGHACMDWELEFDKTSALATEGNRVPITKLNIWRHPDAHPLALLSIILDKYGQESLEWEPETLRLTIERDGAQMSQSTWTKLLAARVLMLSPSPWRQWNAFHVTARGLSGLAPNFVYLEEPDLGHLMVAADCMKIADPSRATSDEVDKFVAAALKHDGQPWAPPMLAFAQRELEESALECVTCGALHRDDNDTRCVTCGSAQLVKVPYVFAALRDQVKAAYMSRQRSGSTAGLRDDDPGDMCAARLLEAWDYAKARRAGLAQQLRMFR